MKRRNAFTLIQMPAFRRRKRSAFTLIEMLVVIGVILILVSMSVLGYDVVERAAAGNQTKTTLANLNAMLSELDADAGSGALPSYAITTSVTTFNPRTHVGTTVTTTSSTIGAGVVDSTPYVWEVGDVTTHGTDPITGRYGNIVQQTEVVMQNLMRAPNNSKAVGQLPSSKLLRDLSGNPVAGPVLLDGWDNPIIYVSGGGITVNVTTGNSTNLVNGAQVATPQLVTIKSPDGRPFFASAGPDGNFGAVVATTPLPTPTAGDDNVYSKGQ